MARKRRDDLTPLVAAIYEAAVDPSRWPDAMVAMMRTARVQSCAMNHASFSGPTVLPEYETADTAETTKAHREWFGDRHLLADTTLALFGTGRWIFREMLMEDAAWYRSDVYNELNRPHGIDGFSGLVLKESWFPEAQSLLIAFPLPPRVRMDQRELRLLQLAVPHLRRALDLHHRLREQVSLARAALDALDRLPTGMLLAGATGQMLHANVAAEAMLGRNDGLGLRHGQLLAADPKQTGRLRGLIAEAIQAFGLDPPSSGGAMLLPRPSGLPSWQVTVAPLAPNNPYSVGPAHAAALVMITDPSATVQAPDATLRALFGFTQAEARIALALANGRTPQEIANEYRLSLLTVRTHIRRLHEKLGVRHQGHLIRRIMQVACTQQYPSDSAAP